MYIKGFELRLNPLVCVSFAVNLPRSQSSQATVHRHISLLSTRTHPTSAVSGGGRQPALPPVTSGASETETPGRIEALYLYNNQKFCLL